MDEKENSTKIPSIQLRRALLITLLVGAATTADAASVPVRTLTHNVDGLNWSANSVDIITSLNSQNAYIMSLQEVSLSFIPYALSTKDLRFDAFDTSAIVSEL